MLNANSAQGSPIKYSFSTWGFRIKESVSYHETAEKVYGWVSQGQAFKSVGQALLPLEPGLQPPATIDFLFKRLFNHTRQLNSKGAGPANLNIIKRALG